MSGERGPLSKSPAERRRRNKPTRQGRTITMHGAVKPPSLPHSTWAKEFHPLVKDWWASLVKSAVPQDWEPNEWELARYAAVMMNDCLTKPKVKAADHEALLKVLKELHATPNSRYRANFDVQRVIEERQRQEAAKVSQLESYRSRLQEDKQ